MPVFKKQIFQNVRQVLWVDSSSPFDTEEQTGTAEKPYATIQQAIDHGANATEFSWHINISFGSYSSDPIVIPSNKDYILEGRIRRGSIATGNITWAVTGNRTSLLAFRRIIAGPITINDDVTPAVLAVLSLVDSECKGIDVTGTSDINVTLGGITLGNLDPAVSTVVASTVTGDLTLGAGLVLAQNVQFQAGCTQIVAEQLKAAGCSFSQDIEVSGTYATLGDCVFNGVHSVTCSNITEGTILFDESSSTSFIENNWDTTNLVHVISTQRSTGWISGGLVTRNTGLDVDVTSGSGYIFFSDDVTDYVTWDNDTLTLPSNQLVDIYIDADGNVLSAPSPIDTRDSILLATAFTNSSSIVALAAEQIETVQIVPQVSSYAIQVMGSLHVTGLATTVYSPPSLQLQVDSGKYYNGIHFNSTLAYSPITFTYWYRNGSGGWTHVNSQTAIDANFYDDGSGTLAALPALKWKKDLLFISKNDGATEFHVVYAQEFFSSQSEAEAGNLPSPSDGLLSTSLRLSGVVILGGDTFITSIVDVKPRLGQLSTGSTAVTDHGLLSGLSDDDHSQYQLRTEENQANGYAGLDAFSKLTGSQQVYGTVADTATEGNDPRVPTQNENDALQGTNGASSNTNRFVTNSDTRNTDARTPTTHATTHRPVGTDPIYIFAKIRSTATLTTLTSADDVLLCNGTFAVTLPAATASGKVYFIKNTGIGQITVNAAGGETIDEESSIILTSKHDNIQIVDAASTIWNIL